MARIADYVELWKDKAAELRSGAAHIEHREFKEHLLAEASQWEELAARFDRETYPIN